MPDALDRLKAALADRYRIKRELGRGLMATVYLAEDLKHDREVAIQVVHPDCATALGPEGFQRGATAATALQHPNILPLYDWGQADGILYIVMRYVEGGSLRDRLIRDGTLPFPDAVRILRDVASAITYAHRHGVVHAELRPEKVLLAEPDVVVTDFWKGTAAREQVGREGYVVGNPSYVAPEQIVAGTPCDHRVDIYGLGLLAYEILTGRPPRLWAQQRWWTQLATFQPDPVSNHRRGVPRPFAALIMKCLEPAPKDRWQTAADVLAQLEALDTSPSGVPRQTLGVALRVRFEAWRRGWR